MQVEEKLFPWFANTWQQLSAIGKNKQISLLFTGPSGIGKKILAEQYAKFILCKQNFHHSCGQCRSCILFNAGNHPDFYCLQPEDKGHIIKIDQVRELTDHLSQTSVLGDYQVVIIFESERMNRAAANAFLKTLEEPRGKVCILLTSDQPSFLPATIRSRCMKINLALPKQALSLQWLSAECELAENYLSFADNLPLKARAYAITDYRSKRNAVLQSLVAIENKNLLPMEVASRHFNEAESCVEILFSLIQDLIRIKVASQAGLIHYDQLELLSKLSAKFSAKALFQFLDVLINSSRILKGQTKINSQLLMEEIFISFNNLR